MDQISITITANDWPELTTKVYYLSEALRSQPMPAAPMQMQPVAPVVPVQLVQPQQPVMAPVAPVAPAPTATPTYTQDQLSAAASPLIDAGRVGELQQLLAQFGVQAVTQLPKEQYGAFAMGLRNLGAKI